MLMSLKNLWKRSKMDILPFIPFILLVLFCFYMSFQEEKKEECNEVKKLVHGRASKVEFDGHTYVVWQQNFTDCILHDPDCKCHKGEK